MREWRNLEDIVIHHKKITQEERDVLFVHLSTILGRTYKEITSIHQAFSSEENPDRFFQIIYWLVHLAINEVVENKKRVVTFSAVLSEEIGHHIYGEIWANAIKQR